MIVFPYQGALFPRRLRMQPLCAGTVFPAHMEDQDFESIGAESIGAIRNCRPMFRVASLSRLVGAREGIPASTPGPFALAKAVNRSTRP